MTTRRCAFTPADISLTAYAGSITVRPMEPIIVLAALVLYAPIAAFIFAPACAALAKRRHRHSETTAEHRGAASGPTAAHPARAHSDRQCRRQRQVPLVRQAHGRGARLPA
jgi:hypothetical protein